MDLIEQYIYENTLSKERVLELVDEYTLYCFYISQAYGYEVLPELRKAMRSPIKFKDDTPSFSLFDSRNNFYSYTWKDSAIPESGGIFKLIKLINCLRTYEEVYSLINEDFELGIGEESVRTNKIILADRPPKKDNMNIRVKSKPFTDEAWEFYLQFTTEEVIKKSDHLTQVEYLYYFDEQKAPYIPKTITFAYREWDYLEKRWRYQIYSPKEPKIDRFRNDFTDGVVPGLSRLTYTTDTLIITKASKDILTWESFGYESICGRAETTLIPEKTISNLKRKYKNIIVWLDPDSAGCFASHKYRAMGLKTTTNYRCLLNKSKDLSDHYRDYGRDKTRELIDLLIYGKFREGM